MATELWWGDPQSYIKEIVEEGHLNVAWNMGAIVKYGIDPVNFMNLYASGQPWRAMVIAVEGTREWDHLHAEPIAVHPTWIFGTDQLSLLYDLVENPVGEDDFACDDPDVDPNWRPIKGQRHCVVVDGFPNLGNGPGRRFLTMLGDLQRDHPECKIHLHRPDGFRAPFGSDIGSTDIDIKFLHFGKTIYLGSGRVVKGSEIPRGLVKWLTLVGMTPGDMNVPRNRLIATMRSALWAAENYTKDIDFAVRGRNPHDPMSAPVPMTVRRQIIPQAGDKLACDSCSLNTTCKYAREGSVCSVPASDGVGLARYFRTRDSAKIIEGLQELLAINAERLTMGLENEADDGELDPEVTRLTALMSKNGERLARLVDPVLAASSQTKVAIGIINNGNGGQQITHVAAPQEMMKAAFAALEREGNPRDQITQEMVKNYLERQQQQAIEATAS